MCYVSDWQLYEEKHGGIDGVVFAFSVGLSNGAILSLPKMLLDARRTVNLPQEARFAVGIL